MLNMMKMVQSQEMCLRFLMMPLQTKQGNKEKDLLLSGIMIIVKVI